MPERLASRCWWLVDRGVIGEFAGGCICLRMVVAMFALILSAGHLKVIHVG